LDLTIQTLWKSTLWGSSFGSTLWGSTVLDHRFWSPRPNLWKSTLWRSTLRGSTARATDFGAHGSISGSRLSRGVYSLGVDSLGVDCLGQLILEPTTQSRLSGDRLCGVDSQGFYCLRPPIFTVADHWQPPSMCGGPPGLPPPHTHTHQSFRTSVLSNRFGVHIRPVEFPANVFSTPVLVKKCY
jgi:hypothetical protein